MYHGVNENSLAHGTGLAALEGKVGHLLPDPGNRLLEDAAKGLRHAGAGIDIAARSNVHPGSSRETSEALTCRGDREDSGGSGMGHKVIQSGLIC